MSNAKNLKVGDLVRRKGDPNAPIYRFIARRGNKHSRFQCEKYKGLDGPDDAGFVDVSDWILSRQYERVFAA